MEGKSSFCGTFDKIKSGSITECKKVSSQWDQYDVVVNIETNEVFKKDRGTKRKELIGKVIKKRGGELIIEMTANPPYTKEREMIVSFPDEDTIKDINP